jgi:ABC-type sugar transport system ATPase subunit
MIYVTHDQVEAMTLGDRIVVIEGGRIRQADDPQRTYTAPADPFVASFIGTPADEPLGRNAHDRRGKSRVQRVGLTFPLPARLLTGFVDASIAVTLGIRPEDISRSGDVT